MTRLAAADEAALIAIVREVAAAEIMPRFQRLESGQVDEKSGPHDLVTEADLAAEKAITTAIRARFPEALIVGEEAVAADPALRHRIAEAELAFIIDPVDGTWNFAHGLPLFGVILAATRFGQPIFGLLHDPVMDDWITAGEESPARMVHADGRERAIAVSGGATAATASGFMHFNLLPQAHQQAMAPLYAGIGRIYSLRCSCHEYRVLARGAADFCFSGTLNPWDHLAGAFITRRAGGVARMLDGRDYDAAVTEGFLLVASDEPTWEALRAEIQARLDEVGTAPA
ncbi:inositol monophosphatase [Aquicoccus sp. SCR17]|nr:inositol monophosphatase [Carideicomes alvinocaridis]